MTRSNWILVCVVFMLIAVIGGLTSYGMYVKGQVDGGLFVRQQMTRENWMQDYIDGRVPVCVANDQVYEVTAKRQGAFRVIKAYPVPRLRRIP